MNPVRNNLNKHSNKNSERVISYGMKISSVKNRRQPKMQTDGGQAMMVAVMFFLAGSLMVLAGVSSPVLKDIKIIRNLEESKQSIFLSEGVVEDMVYRIKNGFDFSTTENLTANGVTATATTAVIVDKREVVSVGDKNDIIRTTRVLLFQGDGASFNYGVQTGEGGMVLENFSSIFGNVYSSGPIYGSGQSIIRGSVISAGPSGLIDGVHATSSAYANTIMNSTIDGDVYCQSISNTDVGGETFCESDDQATSTLPISDDLINEWESDAEAGGTITSPCPYIINSDTTIGPIKIECDLEIRGTPTVTLMGAVWVEGNIWILNSSIIRISSSLGNFSVPIIADNPSNRLTSSKIVMDNSTEFIGSGGERSYVFVVSQNNSAENGGDEEAIDVRNTVSGDLLVYAGHGEVLLQNNINLKEVSAYRIRLMNSAEIVYETGLVDLIFKSGPGGGFSIDSWNEIE